MKAEYQQYFDNLEAQGIREYDAYRARVKATTSKGCWLEVEGLNKDIFLYAGYPLFSELQISFDIRPKSRRFFPVVETVIQNGLDRAAHQVAFATA